MKPGELWRNQIGAGARIAGLVQSGSILPLKATSYENSARVRGRMRPVMRQVPRRGDVHEVEKSKLRLTDNGDEKPKGD